MSLEDFLVSLRALADSGGIEAVKVLLASWGVKRASAIDPLLRDFVAAEADQMRYLVDSPEELLEKAHEVLYEGAVF